MYQILLPVDDEIDRAAAQAQYVLGLPGETDEVTVTVAHAYRDEPSDAGGDSFDEESPGVIEAVDVLSAAGITIEQTELYVPVAESIVNLANEIGADEIVVCGRNRSPTGKALFGSVTQSVALDSPVPVTIVGAK
ncbi:universal stress protein [Halogeometricum sp. S1BR25-6]|uniref:Universal stress protein n=1 Tax=Halogeometricum salsisoli TaxID=2950536 RepID=A0ABU2GHP6_9EURY|nr:universal stress protein [Halogeometricum sp. S1BR25-6]MDS0300307.1 universal stress protein [Halogeometricum sp. S1BR25-6]